MIRFIFASGVAPKIIGTGGITASSGHAADVESACITF
jgi:hypothetical protein